MILSELQPVTSVLEQHANMHSKSPRTLSKWGATSSPRRSRKIGTCLWYWKTRGSVRRDIGRCWDNAPRELLKSRKSWRYWKSRWNPSYNHWKSLNIIENHWKTILQPRDTNRITVITWFVKHVWGHQHRPWRCGRRCQHRCTGERSKERSLALERYGKHMKTLGRLWKTMENYGRFKAYYMFSFLDLKWHSAQMCPMYPNVQFSWHTMESSHSLSAHQCK